jgi:hypothetical protein
MTYHDCLPAPTHLHLHLHRITATASPPLACLLTWLQVIEHPNDLHVTGGTRAKLSVRADGGWVP